MEPPGPSLTVRYRSKRGEVWIWYCRTWRAGLWRKSLALAALSAVIALIVLLNREPARWPSSGAPAIVIAVFVLTLLFLAIYPQLTFKPSERTLTAGPSGIDTAIGKMVAHRNWSEIATITDSDVGIALTVARTGNAFIVPNRAFPDSNQRSMFLNSIRDWHGSAKAPSSGC